MDDLGILKILNSNLSDLEKDQLISEYNKNLWIDSLPVSETIIAPPPVTRDPFAAPPAPPKPMPQAAPIAPKMPQAQPMPLPTPAPMPKVEAPAMPQPAKPMTFEELARRQMELLEKQEAPTLETDDGYLGKLAQAQEQEKLDRLLNTLGRAGVMAGNALAGHGYTKADYDLIDTLGKEVGVDKRNMVERENVRSAKAKEKYEQQKDAYNMNRAKIKDVLDTGKDLEQNRMDQRRLGMEASRLDDQLMNSESTRKSQELDRRKGEVGLKLAQLQLRDDKARRDPNSQISNTGRLMYARMLEEIERPDVAASIVSQNMDINQIEDVLGKMNLSNLQTNFNNNILKREALEAKKEESAKKQFEKNEKVADSLRQEIYKIDDSLKYSQMKDAYDAIENQVRTDPSGITDVNLLYDFIKILDPGSVVREGEIALTKQGESLFGKFLNSPKRITRGDILTPATRERMLKIMKDRLAATGRTMTAQLKPRTERAERSGIDLTQVLGTHINDLYQGQRGENREAQDRGIAAFMEQNGIKDRAEAIKILKEAGKL